MVSMASMVSMGAMGASIVTMGPWPGFGVFHWSGLLAPSLQSTGLELLELFELRQKYQLTFWNLCISFL
jgi:hypothetical protein